MWKHEIARDLAQAVYPVFNDLRDFLKEKDKRVKLSSYKEIENYDLSTIISVDDFTGQDKAIISLAIERPNFRKASFLNKITTSDGYLSLIEQYDWFGLKLQNEDEATVQAMISINVTIELLQGNIAEVRAYWNEHLANMAEQHWLKENNIKSKLDREAKAQNGTEFHIYECTLEE